MNLPKLLLSLNDSNLLSVFKLFVFDPSCTDAMFSELIMWFIKQQRLLTPQQIKGSHRELLQQHQICEKLKSYNSYSFNSLLYTAYPFTSVYFIADVNKVWIAVLQGDHQWNSLVRLTHL